MDSKLPIALSASALSLSVLEGIYFWNQINALRKDVSDMAIAMQTLLKKMEENKKQYDANAVQIQGGFNKAFGDMKDISKKLTRTRKDIETADGRCIQLDRTVTLTDYVAATDQENVENLDDVQARWSPDTNAAELAYILYQVPVLVGVHASRMLPK